MTLAMAFLVVSLAAEPPGPPAANPTPATPTPATTTKPATTKGARPVLPAASLPTVEGEVAEIDHRAHRLHLRTAAGDAVLSFDRNTLVLSPTGAATPLQITVGARVRAGRDGDARAAWVELKIAPSTPTASP